MPIFDRCKECKTLKPIGDIGDNGVCADCMELALKRKEQSDAQVTATADKKKSDAKVEKADKAETAKKEKAKKKVEDAEIAEKEKVAATAADVAAKLVADNMFIIKKGDVTKTCESFTQAAEVIGCHPQTVSKAYKAKRGSIGDWSVEYPEDKDTEEK